MALLESEIEEIKFHIGWNALTTGAVPYIGIASIFDQVVRPYLLAGLITSSSTDVIAASVPTPVDLTLAAISGTNTQGTAVSVSVGDRLVIDVDSLQETATVAAISGSVVTVALSLEHTGTYPVTVEGGESRVRQCLRGCRGAMSKIEASVGRAGIKKVDEVEFFEKKSTGGSTVLDDLNALLQFWRQQLYRVLFGVGDRSLTGGVGGGGRVSVY